MIVQEYKLLSATTDVFLTDKVNKLLLLGWKLYGSPLMIQRGTGIELAQAVVHEIERPGRRGPIKPGG